MARTPEQQSRLRRRQQAYLMAYASFASSKAWTPLNLFANGEQGAWYDPSDFSTMFQDSAGTTPVTAVEQPVGLIRDKSGRGNHASQSTTTSRPVLSARVNLLTYSEDFSNAAWSLSNVTSTSTSMTETVTAGGHNVLSSSVAFISGAGYTISVEAKKGVGATAPNWIQLSFGSAAFGLAAYANFNIASGVVGTVSGGSASIVDVGGGYYRISFTATATSSASTGGIIAFTNNADTASRVPNYAGATTSDVLLRKADIRPSNQSNLPPYQRIAAATDYDTSGFPYYLAFDGVDDSLATSSINPGSVDKAQVFAGVRKLSDAAIGIVAELANYASTPGTFSLGAPGSVGATYRFASQGSGGSIATSPTTFAAPLTSVLTGIGDISGDNSTIRINGALAAQNTADQGTGNYGSAAVSIGQRADSTLRFNGNLYGLIFRFSAGNLDSTTITNAETYMNGKTRAY